MKILVPRKTWNIPPRPCRIEFLDRVQRVTPVGIHLRRPRVDPREPLLEPRAAANYLGCRPAPSLPCDDTVRPPRAIERPNAATAGYIRRTFQHQRTGQPGKGFLVGIQPRIPWSCVTWVPEITRGCGAWAPRRASNAPNASRRPFGRSHSAVSQSNFGRGRHRPNSPAAVPAKVRPHHCAPPHRGKARSGAFL
jgi:hypothetical protein